MQEQTEAMTDREAYNEIEQRIEQSEEDQTEVTTDELKALGVLKEQYGSCTVVTDPEHGPVVASGSHDTDPVSYYLIRMGTGKWISLTHYSRLMERDGGSKWVADNIGVIDKTGLPLDDSFESSLRVDLDAEQTEYLRKAYKRECEFMLGEVGGAYDGRRVYMTTRDPLAGWSRHRKNADISLDDWSHEVSRQMMSATPDTSRVLDTHMTSEYAVEVEFEDK
jgi:hypothetical protein